MQILPENKLQKADEIDSAGLQIEMILSKHLKTNRLKTLPLKH